MLSSFHPELPVDARTLLNAPVSNNPFKTLNNGGYVHLGILRYIEKILSCNLFRSSIISMSFNIDGLVLFNNSVKQIWPILGFVNNLGTDLKPFAIGIFYGKSKPEPLDVYLEDFISELSRLIDTGVFLNGKNYSIEIRSFVCDAPAMAYIKCIKLHSGYSFCGKCIEAGDYVNGRVIMRNISAPTRSDQSFRTKMDEDHHLGTSPLLN